MDKHLQDISKQLKKDFKIKTSEFRGQLSLQVPADKILEVCAALKKEHHFEQLSVISSVDYWPEQSPRYHVVYQLNSISRNLRLELRVHLHGEHPSIASVEKVYPNANWFERELWDMMGIQIQNHSDLRRILMPYDWEGHPLRKDYPLGYEEVQFSFNQEEIQNRKPNPKD